MLKTRDLVSNVVSSVNTSQAVAKSTNALKSAKESSTKLRKAYVENLLSTLSPAPTELKIVEKATTITQSISPSESGRVFDSKTGAYDEIEGYRIQFKGKKKMVDSSREEPTTLILRPQLKENVTTPIIDQVDMSDEAAIAANAMETMMMLKELKLDEMENCQEQLDLITAIESKEDNGTPEVIDNVQQPPSKSSASTSQITDQPSNISNNTPGKYDSDQIITVVVPSEVARKVKQARKKKAKMERNSIKPQMSFFGTMWTLIDRMTTKVTRSYLRNLAGSEEEMPVMPNPDEDLYAEEYGLRKHIFSEKVMET